MRKLIFIVFIVFICLISTSCKESTVKEQASPQNSEQSSPQPSQSSDSQGVALVYADPEIDIFLVIPSVDWKYSKEFFEGQVYFYPKDQNPMTSPNGFAISSGELSDKTIDEIWSEEADYLKPQLKDFEWQKEDSFSVGDYTGYRYHFTAEGFLGDYIYWETDKLLYTCSFTSDEETYQNNLTLLIDALGTFKTVSQTSQQ